MVRKPDRRLSSEIGLWPEFEPVKKAGRLIEWGSKAGLVAGGVVLGRSESAKEVMVAVGVVGGSLLVSYVASFLRHPGKLVDLLDEKTDQS